MNDNRNIKRLIIYVSLMALLVLPLIVRLAYLMLILPSKAVAEELPPPEVERGPILDRNGKILAIQTKLFSVTASLPEIDNIRETGGLLAKILNIEEADVIRTLSRKAKFAYIKRKVATSESDTVQSYLNAGQLKGIYLTPESARSYPKQNLVSHITGIAGTDNIGLEGLEWEFNDILYPTTGGSTEKVFGNQLFLTIDLNAQYYVHEAAVKAYQTHNADAVMIMVMEARTGRIVSSVALPDFNPNTFTKFTENERLNRPVTVAYEPGSVFKVFSLASFLELGTLSPQDEFFCNGHYDAVDPRINCLGIHNTVNPQLIIKHSCNVGAAYASEKTSQEELYRMLLDFGFGKKTGIPMPGESAGILTHPSGWSGRSKPTIAFGQEISVSAIQVVGAATALTNGGVLLRPQIVEKVVSPEGKLLQEFHTDPIRRVLSEDVAREMLLYMESATQEGGTAFRAQIEGMRISAKTGTAQVRNPKTGKYSDNHHIASFLGIFPTDAPELIIYVVINNPKGDLYYGSRIAAPVFKEVAEHLIPLLNIQNPNTPTITHTGELVLPRPQSVVLEDIMPDLTGLSKRQLLPLFQREDITLYIRGTGFVVRQSPPPGTEVAPGTVITLELE